MGVVAPLLAVEVPAAIAAAVRRLVGAVLGAEALHRRPGLDQRAVDREVLAAQELPNVRVAEDRRQEFGRDLALKQPVAVGREDGRMPDRIVDPEPHEPAEQEIVVELLDQQPFRAHRVKRRQQQRPQQPLGCDRGPAQMRVQRLELARQRAQRLVDHRPDQSQRVIRRHPGLEIDVTEQTARLPILTPHPPNPHLVAPCGHTYHIAPPRATFSAACSHVRGQVPGQDGGSPACAAVGSRWRSAWRAAGRRDDG